MRSGLAESVQLMEQREMNTNIEYEQLQHRAASLREELHTEIEKMINDVIKFKMHIQKSLEDYEEFVAEEVEKELGNVRVAESPGDILASADIIWSCLANEGAVEDVYEQLLHEQEMLRPIPDDEASSSALRLEYRPWKGVTITFTGVENKVNQAVLHLLYLLISS